MLSMRVEHIFPQFRILKSYSNLSLMRLNFFIDGTSYLCSASYVGTIDVITAEQVFAAEVATPLVAVVVGMLVWLVAGLTAHSKQTRHHVSVISNYANFYNGKFVM